MRVFLRKSLPERNKNYSCFVRKIQAFGHLQYNPNNQMTDGTNVKFLLFSKFILRGREMVSIQEKQFTLCNKISWYPIPAQLNYANHANLKECIKPTNLTICSIHLPPSFKDSEEKMKNQTRNIRNIFAEFLLVGTNRPNGI